MNGLCSRRRVLQVAGISTEFLLSGCFSRTETNTTTTQSPFVIADQNFRILGKDSSLEKDEANVSFIGRTIKIEGIIQASQSCHSAKLSKVDVDPKTMLLEVEIKTYKPQDAESCADTSTGVKYEATFEFDDEVPGHVTVEHNGERANDGPESD